MLTPTTGLIEVSKTNKGIEAVCLLGAGIKPKRLVEVRTDDVKGFFRVQEVEHSGDSGYSGDFYSKFRAVQFGAKG